MCCLSKWHHELQYSCGSRWFKVVVVISLSTATTSTSNRFQVRSVIGLLVLAASRLWRTPDACVQCLDFQLMFHSVVLAVVKCYWWQFTALLSNGLNGPNIPGHVGSGS
eukprot:1541854-Amphidinium_carterae.1